MSEVILWFFIYSSIGWIYEVLYATLTRHQWENRGFLYGPSCPIYGVGAVSCILLLHNLTSWQIFLIGMVGACVLEYVTASTLERHFHAKWWDYSKVPLNIKGYICLPAAVGFGVAAILIKTCIHPYVSQFTKAIPYVMQDVLSYLLIALIAADLSLTIASLTSINRKLEEVTASFDKKMEDRYVKIGQSFSRSELLVMGKVKKFTNEKYDNFRDKLRIANLKEKGKEISNKLGMSKTDENEINR
ncbi:membrane protein [Lachnospiraceae bacterium KM106-2]|nr:membrane protein [Lachnospiraceae bacterium KM106-2]